MTTLRVGHKGADHITPGNTLASFDAALEVGVDMIEFDVLCERRDGSGRLLLAHDFEDAADRRPLTLDEALEHFQQPAFDGVGLIVDLKMEGYEERAVATLRRHAMDQRALISTMEEPSLRLLRARHPDIRLGWSFPRIRRDPMRNPVTIAPAFALLYYARFALPSVVANLVRRGEIDALMAHWRLVTPRMARIIADSGGELFVWTVDDAQRIAWLQDLDVAGVISNDPRLFATAAEAARWATAVPGDRRPTQ